MRLGEAFSGAVQGAMLAEHVPDYRNVGAKDATQWFEDRVCAERDVVPGEVWAAATENDCKANRGYHAGPMFMISQVAIFCAHMYDSRKTDAEDETQYQLLLRL